MRALPGTSRTPARAGRTDRTGAWRVAVVAILLALTAAGLRSRGTFSHAPDRVLALLVALPGGPRRTRRRLARPPGDLVRLALGESLAAGRAALAGPPGRDPRAAIIACYTAMERGFAAAGSAPAAADTPAEVLARATGAGLVRSGSAVRMAGLFRRARYSSQPMTSADSAAAAARLAQVQADLG